jgi:hypothetical protein
VRQQAGLTNVSCTELIWINLGSRFDLGDELDERIYGTRARESEVQRGDDGQYLWLFGADSHMRPVRKDQRPLTLSIRLSA